MTAPATLRSTREELVGADDPALERTTHTSRSGTYRPRPAGSTVTYGATARCCGVAYGATARSSTVTYGATTRSCGVTYGATTRGCAAAHGASASADAIPSGLATSDNGVPTPACTGDGRINPGADTIRRTGHSVPRRTVVLAECLLEGNAVGGNAPSEYPQAEPTTAARARERFSAGLSRNSFGIRLTA